MSDYTTNANPQQGGFYIKKVGNKATKVVF